MKKIITRPSAVLQVVSRNRYSSYRTRRQTSSQKPRSSAAALSKHS